MWEGNIIMDYVLVFTCKQELRCFYELFEVSFWWYPFTAEDLLAWK